MAWNFTMYIKVAGLLDGPPVSAFHHKNDRHVPPHLAFYRVLGTHTQVLMLERQALFY